MQKVEGERKNLKINMLTQKEAKQKEALYTMVVVVERGRDRHSRLGGNS